MHSPAQIITSLLITSLLIIGSKCILTVGHTNAGVVLAVRGLNFSAMKRSEKIALNFTAPFAQVAALDELSIAEDKARVEILREVIEIGLNEKLIEHPVIWEAYEAAKAPAKRKPPKRAKVYRLLMVSKKEELQK
jgi:hypothetical protein